MTDIPNSFGFEFWALPRWKQHLNLLAKLSGAQVALITKIECESFRISLTNDSCDNLFAVGNVVPFSSQTFCYDTLGSRDALLVENASRLSRWSSDSLVNAGWENYFGIKLCYPDGAPFGTLCLLDTTQIAKSEAMENLLIHFRDVIETDIRFVVAHKKSEAANLAKSRFLANMSHEIRTPMNVILGFADVLKEDALSPEKKSEYLDRIRTNGAHLLHLIDDILDLTKVEAGEIKIQIQNFNLPRLIYEVFQSTLLLAKRKNIRAELNLRTPIPSVISSDSVRLRQILTNLLGNAVKFTEQGTVALNLSFEEDRTGECQLIFEIEDTGIGISNLDRGSLFRAFQQGDDSITRQYGGTGLGLSLSQRLCELLGAKVDLRWSERGRGSCFSVVLPVHNTSGGFVSAINGFEVVESALSDLTQELHRGLKLLIAEDSPDNVALIRAFLKSENVHLDVASDGFEAMRKAVSNDYDVIFMDIQMPNLDGLEATKRLRAAGYRMPIVALTAHALPEEIQKFLKAGCNQHLAKPIEKAKFIRLLREYSKPFSSVLPIEA